MTTSTYAPALQAPFGQYQSPFDQAGLYQQQFGVSPYGPQGIEQQAMPTIALITQQLVNAQQCVWTAQHLLAQLMPQIAQITHLPGLPSSQFGLPFGQFGQRQLPRQYQFGW